MRSHERILSQPEYATAYWKTTVKNFNAHSLGRSHLPNTEREIQATLNFKRALMAIPESELVTWSPRLDNTIKSTPMRH